MKSILFVIFSIIINFSFGQTSVKVSITNSNIVGKAYLLYEDANKNKTLIDTCTIVRNQVKLSISDTLNDKILMLGFFTPYSEKPTEIPLIISNEKTIELEITFPDIISTCNIILSENNKIHFDFIQKNMIFQEKSQLFNGMMKFYSDKPNSDFYKALQQEKFIFEEERQLFYSHFFDKSTNSSTNNFIKHQIEMETQIFSQLSVKNEELFLNSPFAMQWIWTYISKFTTNNPNHSFQVENYKKAIDSLNSFLSYYPNKEVKFMKTVADEMEKAGFEDITLYIYDNIIIPNTCEPDEKIVVKAECLEKIQIGKLAPEIILNKKEVGIASLQKIKANYTLIVFWASWCGHCQNLIPELDKFYKSNKKTYDLEILAISIDNNTKNWNDFTTKNNLQWYNYCDFKSWNSTSAVDYCIRSTPAMFLLDKNKIIVAKPQTVAELEMILENELH